MNLSGIRLNIEAMKGDLTLCEETNFANRADAIDYLDFHVIDRIYHLLSEKNQPEELIFLKEQAHNLKNRLEQINLNLFQRLRTNIQSGTLIGKAFKDEIDKYLVCSLDTETQPEEICYDNMDLMINGIFPIQDLPSETREREPEMVFYQKTPFRIIFELAGKIHFSEKDVFYDLGSGLGQVTILVNLLCGARSIGVEFEPEFCQYARICASVLNLKNVEFINADARQVIYSEGTVFFMFTPFTGRVLQEMLKVLQKESEKKIIRLFTYGPCTVEVAKENWLKTFGNNANELYKLSEFRSF